MPGAKWPSKPLGCVLADLTPKGQALAHDLLHVCLFFVMCASGFQSQKMGRAVQHTGRTAEAMQAQAKPGVANRNEEREMSEQKLSRNGFFFLKSSNGEALDLFHQNSPRRLFV
jgi:hypothetical protein